MATQATVPKLETRALALVESVRAIHIADQPSYDAAAEAIFVIKAMRKEVADHHDPIIASANTTHKLAVAAKRKLDNPLQERESHIKTGIRGFDEMQERLRLEAQHKADEEARKQEEEAKLQAGIEAERQGASKEDVQAIVEAPSTAPPPVMAPTYQKRQGVSVRENWKAQVVNLKLLVQAVSLEQAPLTCLQANQVALNQLARAQKQALSIPGVRAVNDAVVSARR